MKFLPRKEEFTIGEVIFNISMTDPIEAALTSDGISEWYSLYFESPQLYELRLSEHVFNRHFVAVVTTETGKE